MGAAAGIPGIGRAMQAGRGVAPVPTGIPPPMPGGMPPRGVPPMPPGLMGPGRGGKLFLNFLLKKVIINHVFNISSWSARSSANDPANADATERYGTTTIDSTTCSYATRSTTTTLKTFCLYHEH